MECAAKGRGTRCVGPAIRRCARCGAVAYCSLSHQISHWSDHEQECERLEEQMRDADILNTFPFTFSEEATLQILKEKESRCTFLSKRSIHQRGIWSCECSCGVSNTNHNCPASINCWNLPSTLVPCSGPDKELIQLAVFGELLALIPDYDVHIDFVGPAIPDCSRDGETTHLHSYVRCDDRDCECKDPSETSSGSVVTMRLLKGFYHDRFKDLMKDSFPHLIIAPNAGVAAYPSWMETVELIHGLNTPAVFTDFCEEAAHLAACCLSSATGCKLALPIQLNPFRQPMAVEDTALHVPCYSNCFLFGI
ncbi:zinc finger MYND domain-containing protein 15-like isoform X3 [Chenopodium quinoa]|uniref:zinc finger MYND domain-containing protein 15-like isoform X3 n=1 Tax=Chenopodium quinoa TaxID=63459 RepID=UPI000B785973|nr:zinc finger MYND domain-containing protein 15-like isoform X3 [Chenopodium quinoa]